jgi:hypothetical protein
MREPHRWGFSVSRSGYFQVSVIIIKLTAKAVRYRQSDLDSWIAAKVRTSTRDYDTAR